MDNTLTVLELYNKLKEYVDKDLGNLPVYHYGIYNRITKITLTVTDHEPKKIYLEE